MAVTPGRDFGQADTSRFIRFSTANSMPRSCRRRRDWRGCWPERRRRPPSSPTACASTGKTPMPAASCSTSYLKFLERAHRERLCALGILATNAQGRHGRHVRGQRTMRYLRPARLDDEFCYRDADGGWTGLAHNRSAGARSPSAADDSRCCCAKAASASAGSTPRACDRRIPFASCNHPDLMNQDLSIIHLVTQASSWCSS